MANSFDQASCSHSHSRAGAIRGFVGSVAHHPYTDENRAAHGGVTYTEECSACGARRWVNQNGCHFEFGTWGPSRRERQSEATRLQSTARALVAKVQPLVLHSGDRRAVVTLDSDGLLSVAGAEWEEILPTVAATAWLDGARAARRALLTAEAAQGEV